MANLASIKTNILLTAIIVPLAILFVVFVIVSVWFWNDKFTAHHKQEFDKKLNVSKALNETIYGNDKGHIKNKNEMLFRPLSLCKCYKKFSSFSFADKEKACRQKIIKSCVGAKSADRVRINSLTSNSHNEPANKAKRDVNFINLLPLNYINAGAQLADQIEQHGPTDTMTSQVNSNKKDENVAKNNADEDKQDSETLTSTAMGLDECQIASESQLTLASHFEENNWDYNFATRGLYLNQPWSKGRYGRNFEDTSEHSGVSDSFATSKCGVLTLDIVNNDYPCTPDDVTKIIKNDNGDGDDTDGYYA